MVGRFLRNWHFLSIGTYIQQGCTPELCADIHTGCTHTIKIINEIILKEAFEKQNLRTEIQKGSVNKAPSEGRYLGHPKLLDL